MVKAKVSLELQWLHDCGRFKRVYISKKGWEIVEKIEVANEKSWRASAMPGTCFRVYELHYLAAGVWFHGNDLPKDHIHNVAL